VPSSPRISERLRFGVLGASWIADRAVLPAIHAAGNAVATLIASRDVSRAHTMADRHGVARVATSYEELVEHAEIDAVYIGLHNSLHREWTLKALAAGKHVLCEKPLAMSAAEARVMAAASHASGRILMEAFMYRFHPRMQALPDSADGVRFMHAGFAFALAGTDNYRWHAGLGGGALLDVGCYTLDVARWLLGSPESVYAAMTGEAVDTSVVALLSFASGAVATAWASFEGPEYQELVLIDSGGRRVIAQPFTAWRDPDDPYRLMVEAFATSVLSDGPSPLPLSESIATAELIDRVRQAASTRTAT
jgi:D-xylose 1-dehydrogenase (NADP+, D-xylono-1,5-lactone-forming)